MGFFQPNLLYFVLCYDFHVGRKGRKRREKIEESKNVQTTRTYWKRNRPLPYYHPNCRTPRHWKFTLEHRITRPPQVLQWTIKESVLQGQKSVDVSLNVISLNQLQQHFKHDNVWGQVETIEHLFFECDRVSMIWSLIEAYFKIKIRSKH